MLVQPSRQRVQRARLRQPWPEVRCLWGHGRHPRLPPAFGLSPTTAHRRFTVWMKAGVWRLRTGRYWRSPAHEANSTERQRSSMPPRCAGDRGPPSGPDPVDRGTYGSKPHVPSEAESVPLAVGVCEANTRDSLALKALQRAYRRCGPSADRTADVPASSERTRRTTPPALWSWLRERGIPPASPDRASTPPSGLTPPLEIEEYLLAVRLPAA